MDTIHIAVAANDTYLPHCGAMLHSTFSNTSARALHVHFIHRPGFSSAGIEKLRALTQAHGHQFSDHATQSEWFDDYPVNDQYTEETWYRLHLHQVLPSTVQRILWLDSDAIVRHDIQALWNSNLQQHSIAVATNPLSSEDRQYARSIGLTEHQISGYFNAGIMLIDIPSFATELDNNRAAKMVATFGSRPIRYVDQDILNLIFADRYQTLHPKWNFRSGALFFKRTTAAIQGSQVARQVMHDPAIIHYTTTNMKPWHYRCPHPWRNLYLEHRQAAGFGDPDYGNIRPVDHIIRHIPFNIRTTIHLARHRKLRLLADFWYWSP